MVNKTDPQNILKELTRYSFYEVKNFVMELSRYSSIEEVLTWSAKNHTTSEQYSLAISILRYLDEVIKKNNSNPFQGNDYY